MQWQNDFKLLKNEGFSSISILFVLKHIEEMSIAKGSLVLPLVTNKKLVTDLSRKNLIIRSHEEFIIKFADKINVIRKSYNSSLPAYLNSLMMLSDLEKIKINFNRGSFRLISDPINYDVLMGDYLKRIFNSSKKIANIINTSDTNLFLNFRIDI